MGSMLARWPGGGHCQWKCSGDNLWHTAASQSRRLSPRVNWDGTEVELEMKYLLRYMASIIMKRTLDLVGVVNAVMAENTCLKSVNYQFRSMI